MKDCAHVPELGSQQAPARKPRPTIEELREYLNYDAETGALRWKKSIGKRIKAGQLAGGLKQPSPGRKYLGMRFKGCELWVHRVAFALHHDRWPTPYCDHVDGNSLNNRADNLRECSASANAHNTKMRRDNSVGIKGVRRMGNGYQARVRSNGKRIERYFCRLEDAAAFAKQLRGQLHGEFARHE